MLVSRRGFLSFCRNSAGALGLGALELARLETAFASPTAPTVLWLQGATCSGCSISLLNYISASAPKTIADVLITNVNLAYHPELMGASGDMAVGVINNALAAGGYILVVEGSIPTAFGGNACIAWTAGGQEVTLQQAVQKLAPKASQLISVGTCASFGGVPSAPPNPAGVQPLSKIAGRATLNISGCPPHPNWMVWGIVNAIAGTVGAVDSYGRPKALYGKIIHNSCPRREHEDASSYGQDNRCMQEMGCRGPQTYGQCSTLKWNNGQNWCVDANSQCLGCTSPGWPGSAKLRRVGLGG